jgi:hypothetical protein
MFRRYWPFFVPCLFFVLLLVLQPADRFVVPQDPPLPNYPLSGSLTRLVSDDSDTLAYAMRAENANRGRKAGLVGPRKFDPITGWRAFPEATNVILREAPYEPDPLTQDDFNQVLTTPAEFRNRYFLEYPPAALYLFRLGLIGSSRAEAMDVHPALLDNHQLNVSWHTPKTDGERSLFRAFRHAIRAYGLMMLLTLVGLMALVKRGVGAKGTARGPIWLFLLPGFLYFTPCRYDILPATLVLCAIAAGDRKRVWLSGGCLGLAVALKMYPLVLAPILLRYVAKTWGQAVAWCLVMAVPIVLSYGTMTRTDGINGATVPLKFQFERDPEPEWCFYGRLLPLEWVVRSPVNSLIRTAPVLLIVLMMALQRPADLYSLLRRCTIAVLLFISFQQFFSPQWWQWIAVLLVPLVREHRWLLAFIITHDLLTYLHFPLLFDSLYSPELEAWNQWASARFGEGVTVGGTIRSAHVWLRAVMWLGVFIAFVRSELRPTATSPVSGVPGVNP